MLPNMKSEHFSEFWFVENDDLNLPAQHEDVVKKVKEEEAADGRQNDFKLKSKSLKEIKNVVRTILSWKPNNLIKLRMLSKWF